MADDTPIPWRQTYTGRHAIPRRARGRARDYACEDCGASALHWATIHGRDGSKPEDYRPLCNPCHIAYDGGHAGERNGRVKLTEDQVREIRRRYAAGGVGLGTLGREFGLAKQTIHKIVKGKNWRHVA